MTGAGLGTLGAKSLVNLAIECTSGGVLFFFTTLCPHAESVSVASPVLLLVAISVIIENRFVGLFISDSCSDKSRFICMSLDFFVAYFGVIVIGGRIR